MSKGQQPDKGHITPYGSSTQRENQESGDPLQKRHRKWTSDKLRSILILHVVIVNR